jgi:hypothetical protein
MVLRLSATLYEVHASQGQSGTGHLLGHEIQPGRGRSMAPVICLATNRTDEETLDKINTCLLNSNLRKKSAEHLS